MFLIILAVQELVFKGGGGQQLMQAMLERHPACVVLVADPEISYPAFTIHTSDAKDFQRLAKSKGNILLKAPFDGGVSPIAWPDGFVQTRSIIRYVVKTQSQDWSKINPSKIELQSNPDEGVAPSDLSVITQQNVKIDPFFANLRLQVMAKGCTTKEFLQASASALGGKLTKVGSDWSIDFDPREYRVRAVTLWNRARDRALLDGDDVLASDAAFTAMVLTETSDSLLTKAAADPQTDVGKAFKPGTPVYRLAYQRVEILESNSADHGASLRSTFESIVDPRQPIYGVIRLRSACPAAFYNKKGDHRIQI